MLLWQYLTIIELIFDFPLVTRDHTEGTLGSADLSKEHVRAVRGKWFLRLPNRDLLVSGTEEKK